MRTILTRFFSTFLAGAATLSVAAAPQELAKVSTGINRSVTAVAAAAERPAEVNQLQNRVRTYRGANALSFGVSGLQAPTAKALQGPFGSAEGFPTNMFGNVVFSNSWGGESKAGLYSIPATATGTQDLLVAGVSGTYGGVLVDGVYYAHDYVNFMGFLQIFTVSGYDIESGEKVFSMDGENPSCLTPGGITYDPTTGNVYAIMYDATGQGQYFSTVTYGKNAMSVNPIAPITENFNTLACTADGVLYGIKFNATGSTLVKFDKENGTYTTVGETGMVPNYLSSAAIDPKTGRMYWNVCPADETGWLVEVDLATGVATPLYRFPGDDEVLGLTIPAPAAEDKAPAAVADLALSFPEGNLSGKVKFTAPTTLFDGSKATGALTYKVMANGEVIAEGNTTCGATVEAAYTAPQAGEYSFVVITANNVGNSPKAKAEMFIGNGVPKSTKVTATYVNGVAELTWTPVTTSVDGGYVNPAEVTYTVVRYPDGKKVGETLATTLFSQPLPEPEQLTVYSYGVTATFAGNTSAEAKSNVLVLGNILPPYSEDFTDSAALDGYTIIDANGDGKTWVANSGGVRVSYNTKEAMDDWFITPPMKLKGGQAYLLSFDSKCYMASSKEKLEVMMGDANTAEAMTTTLMPATLIGNTEYETYTAYLCPETDGVYYVGFHGISDKNMWHLYLDNISVSAGVDARVPGAPTDVELIPGAAGALEATINFTTPEVDITGKPLSSLTKLEVFRGTENIFTLNDAATGRAFSITDKKVPAEGQYTYTVVTYNEYGKGREASASAYIGIDYPAAPAEASFTESAEKTGEVTVTWSPVTTMANGSELAADKVRYNVYALDGNNRVALAKNIGATEYTYQAVTAGQEFMQYAVFAVTRRGEGEGQVTDFLPVGKPYTDFAESFPNGTLNYIWGLGPVPGAAGMANWKLVPDGTYSDVSSQDNDGAFIMSEADYINYGGMLFSGKISLKDLEAPGLTFYTFNISGSDPNTIAVGVRTDLADDYTMVLPATPISAFSNEVGWTKVTVDLSAYKGKTIQFCFETMVKKSKLTLLDNIKIADLLDNDLMAAKIEAPANVAVATPYNVNVTVANEGVLKATAYTVELYADGEKVDTKAGEVLEPGAKTVVAFAREFSEVATEPVVYQAKVVYAADQDVNNNETEEFVVAPKVSRLPAPTDLKAEATDGGVKLTWNEPNLSFSPIVTEDFENADAFAKTYGDWTFVDVDDSPVGGFQDSNIPGVTPGETKAAFFVFDASNTDVVGQFADSFRAHSGSKYLASLFRYDDGQADDWAISPELDGSKQTVSFFAKSYSDQYPDAFEVYYSTGSKNPADFVKVVDKTVAPKDWTEYYANLPEGAKYFAIRSCATGAFMLMVDDVTFQPAGGGQLTLEGYEVYRDGVKITDTLVEETEYVDTDAVVSEHEYVVVAVFTTGKSAPSNVASLSFSDLEELLGGVSVTTAPGTILVAGAEGLQVSVVAVDGKLLYSAEGNATVNVLPGVYVVKAGEKIVKVLVK